MIFFDGVKTFEFIRRSLKFLNFFRRSLELLKFREETQVLNTDSPQVHFYLGY